MATKFEPDPEFAQTELFDTASPLPEGFLYEPAFVGREEEATLVAKIAALPLEEAQYKEYTAKRRTVSYGSEYDFTRNALERADSLPAFLLPLREKIAAWARVPAEKFVHGLVSEYRPGTQLGWHRDVPNFELIAGVSLGGWCRMRLRPYRRGEPNRRQDVIALELAPRSAYLMRENARWNWQHSIAPTKALRYSITFRTARAARDA